MRSDRIAVPDALRPAAEAASRRLGEPRLHFISPPLPGESRQRLRWQRLWQERRASAGATPAESEAALQDASLRALLLALDHGAEAALLHEADAGCTSAWRLIEPLEPTGCCADLYMATLPETAGGGPLGWFDWPGSAEASRAADQYHVAAKTAGRMAGASARLVALDFSNGRNALPSLWERWLQTLRTRIEVQERHLYSPLFYRQGALQVVAMVQALGKADYVGTVSVLCVPRLQRQEFAAALLAAGGSWAGPFRAGAETAAARLGASPEAAVTAATVYWLQRALIA